MWHEARKQEKKIREVMVDFQRRAERRREHYDKLKADPTTYLRVIATKASLHLDPTKRELESSMIPWQGDADNLISRYDVRMHMDIIPDYSKLPEIELSWEEKFEENKINYERYRSIIMNEFNNVSEADALAKIEVEEMFSDIKKPGPQDKKKLKNKAAIGYNYEQGTSKMSREEKNDEISDESDYEMDFDVDILSTRQIDKLNVTALNYGVTQGYFTKSLRSEKSVLMERKQAKIAEMEKSAFSGKKARKERRIYKELVLRSRPYSPPLYSDCTTGLPSYTEELNQDNTRSGSSSRSSSPEGKMEFITEFGGNDPPSLESSHVTSSSSHVTSSRKKKKRKDRSPQPRRKSRWDRSHSRSRSRDRERSRSRERYDSKHGQRSRSRSHSNDRASAITKSKLEAKKLVAKKPATPILHQKQQTEKGKLTPQERLKRKMQMQLSKTFKEDKKTEREKAEIKEIERLEREEKIKEETFKLKQRERQRLGLDDSPSRRSPSPFNY